MIGYLLSLEMRRLSNDSDSIFQSVVEASTSKDIRVTLKGLPTVMRVYDVISCLSA